MAKKKVKVYSPNSNYSGEHATGNGVVKFKNGVASCSEQQVEDLLQRGFLADPQEAAKPQKPEVDESIQIIHKLTTENKELTAAVDGLSQQIAGFESLVTDLTQEITTLQQQLSEVGKKD